MGCPLTIEEKDGNVVVNGNTCKRGELYGKEEFTHPKRSVTTLVKLDNGGVASVKTTCTVPKEMIFDVVDFIGKLTAPSTVKIGDVIAENVLNTGANIVITGVR